MIEADLRAVLLAAGAVSAIVGTRVAAMLIPEGDAAPYVTYQLISAERHGSMSAPGTMRNARIQLTCWSASYGEAKQLALAVAAAIDGAALFQAVQVGDQDLYDPTAKLYAVALDYSLWQDNPGA